MLLKSCISKNNPDTDEWLIERLSLFTSSKISTLCKPKGIGVGGIKYIYKCVGEELSGIPIDRDFESSATVHGRTTEFEAIEKASPFIGENLLIMKKFIVSEDGRNGSTPDAIIVIGDKYDYLEVESMEVKCPETYEAYINLAICESTTDLKKADDDYYWQVLHQMYVCNAKKAYFVAYHPFLRAGGLHIIEFNLSEVQEDYVFMLERLKQAEDIYNEVRNKLINKKVFINKSC